MSDPNDDTVEDKRFYTGRLTEPFFQNHWHTLWGQRLAKVVIYLTVMAITLMLISLVTVGRAWG